MTASGRPAIPLAAVGAGRRTPSRTYADNAATTACTRKVAANICGCHRYMVCVTSCGPTTPATTPPPITKDRARGRNAGETPSAAANRNDSTTAAYAPPKKVARQKSQNELDTMAAAASNPTSTPQAVPARNAARLPWRRAMAPTGMMQAAMPTTKMEMGSVASALSGASMSPTIAPVA